MNIVPRDIQSKNRMYCRLVVVVIVGVLFFLSTQQNSQLKINYNLISLY